jgi:hypothetical protein
LPTAGFVSDTGGYRPPEEQGQMVSIQIRPDSERLSLLAPFGAPVVADFQDLDA